MSVWLAIIDLFKAALWPIAIAFIVIWYKNDIRGLLPRLREAGPAGIKLDATVLQRVATSTVSIGLKELPGLPRTKAMAQMEAELHQSLELVEPSHQIYLLVTHLARARLAAFFERSYSLIFGSQIAMLHKLNITDVSTFDEAEAFFEPYQSKYEEFYRDYGFEGWLGFLLTRRLVQQDGEHLAITEIGRDFLLYLSATGLNEVDKAG